MFIANPKRTFVEVRGLNSPAGATMVPAVPLPPLTIRKIPFTKRQSRAGRKMQLGPSGRWFFSYLRLSAALASLPPRRRSSVNSSEVVLDRGCAPQAAQRTARSALVSRLAERSCDIGGAHGETRAERLRLGPP
jgi:hypothetical protein